MEEGYIPGMIKIKKFYVEWSGVRTYQNNTVETFQAVLFDPDYYVTPTGDGDILLQFKEFNNDSYGSYGWDQILVTIALLELKIIQWREDYNILSMIHIQLQRWN